jgi:hypothetical protein
MMAENIHEIEDLVKLAKGLDVRISIAVAHEYCNAKASAPASNEIREIAEKLVELKKKAYPLVNSISYFKVIAKREELGVQTLVVSECGSRWKFGSAMLCSKRIRGYCFCF